MERDDGIDQKADDRQHGGGNKAHRQQAEQALALGARLLGGDRLLGIAGGDHDQAQVAHSLYHRVTVGRGVGRQPHVVGIGAAQRVVDVIQVGHKEGAILGIQRREQAQGAGNGERHLGIIARGADRQPQRVTHGQSLLRQKVAADQNAIGGDGQPVHQFPQRFVVGKVGPEKGHPRKVDPVDAQDLPRLLPPADVGCGAIIPHPCRGLDTLHLQVLADRQKEPQRLVLRRRVLRRRVLAGQNHRLGLFGAFAQFGQVQIGADLVVDLVPQVLVEGDRHRSGKGRQADRQRQEQQRPGVLRGGAGQLPQGQQQGGPGQPVRQPGQQLHQHGEKAQEQQPQRKAKEHRHQKEQRVGKGIIAARAKADRALLGQLVPTVKGWHQQDEIQKIALPHRGQQRPGLLPAQGDDGMPGDDEGRHQQGQQRQSHTHQAVHQRGGCQDDGHGRARAAGQDGRVEEGVGAAHQLRHPLAQHQSPGQAEAAQQQPLQQVEVDDFAPRDPPAAHDGNLALAAAHDHARDQADKVHDQADDRQAKDGQHQRQQAARPPVTLQGRHGGNVEGGVVEQDIDAGLDGGDVLQEPVHRSRPDPAAVIDLVPGRCRHWRFQAGDPLLRKGILGGQQDLVKGIGLVEPEGIAGIGGLPHAGNPHRDLGSSLTRGQKGVVLAYLQTQQIGRRAADEDLDRVAGRPPGRKRAFDELDVRLELGHKAQAGPKQRLVGHKGRILAGEQAHLVGGDVAHLGIEREVDDGRGLPG